MAEYVRDTFAPRTIALGASPGSWGAAEPGPGGGWGVFATATVIAMSVQSGNGRINYTSGSGGQANCRLSSSAAVAEVHGAIVWRCSTSDLAANTGIWMRISGNIDSWAGYGIRAIRDPVANNAAVELLRGPVNAPTIIATLPVLSWPNYASYMQLELELLGASPTRVRGRAYPASSPPADDTGWTEVTDSTGPQGAGNLGIRSGRSGSVAQPVYVADIWQADPLRPAFTTTWDESGLTGTFDSGISTGDPAAWAWDFGDGSAIVTTPTATHSYNVAGTYNVTLTLTTKWGTRRLVVTPVTTPGGIPLPVPPVLPTVYVNGQDVCDRLYSASWRVGRTRWPDDTVGSTLSLQLRGRLPDVFAGSKVVVQTPPGTPGGIVDLWRGDVDAIAEDIDPVDSRTTTTITAMDVLSFLGRWHVMPGTTMPEGGLPTRVASLAPRPGITYRQKWAGVAGTRWPTLKSLASIADKLRDRTYLDILRDGLRASIATAYAAPDGAIVYAPLDPPAGVTPPVLDLDVTGPNCPDHLDQQRQSPEGIVNRWTVGDGSAVDRAERASIEAYGEGAWSVGSGVLKSDATFPLTDEMVAGLRDPFNAGQVTIPIRDWASTAYKAQPLDSASLSGVLYGILGAAHQVDYQGGWSVDLTLDRDPWSITGTVPPVTPPVVKTATETFTCDRDALLAAPNMGAGKSGRLPVGYWSGDKFRALIRFGLTYAHKPSKIISAEVLLTTAGQDMVGYGSPSIHIDRVTGPWSEGSAGNPTGPPWTFSTSNAVVWPGPSTTTSGRKSPNTSGAEDTLVTVSITEIVRAWQSGSANYGVCIRSQTEGSNVDTTEFYSREFGTSSKRPRLRVTYEYQV